MHCPDCAKSMIILEYAEIELDFCPHCKGCWLDEGELEQIVGDPEAALDLFDWKGGRVGKRRCPRCLDKLHVVQLPGQGPEVDVCPQACGIWFDEGELRAAIRAQLPEEQAAGIVRTLNEIFGGEAKS